MMEIKLNTIIKDEWNRTLAHAVISECGVKQRLNPRLSQMEDYLDRTRILKKYTIAESGDLSLDDILSLITKRVTNELGRNDMIVEQEKFIASVDVI